MSYAKVNLYGEAHHGVTLLEQLVHDDQSLEGLDLVRQDRLRAEAVPNGEGRVIVPRVDDAFCPSASIIVLDLIELDKQGTASLYVDIA